LISVEIGLGKTKRNQYKIKSHKKMIKIINTLVEQSYKCFAYSHSYIYAAEFWSAAGLNYITLLLEGGCFNTHVMR